MTSLSKLTLSVPLTQGLDTKSDPKQLRLGKMTRLRNLVFTETGELSCRPGYEGLSQSILGGGSISSGKAISTLNDSLLLADGKTLYGYSQGQDNWAPKGLKEAIGLSTHPVTGSASNVSGQDSSQHSAGISLFSWINRSTQKASYAVVDFESKAPIVPEAGQFTATVCKPCVIDTNTSFSVFLQNGSDIQVSSVPLASPGSPTSATNLLAITPDSAPFDLCVGAGSAFLFYVNGSNVISLSRVSSGHTVTSTVTLSGSATCLTCWFDSAGNSVWLAWHDGTSVKYAVYDSALNPVLSATTVQAEATVSRLTGATIGTIATLYYEVAGTSPSLSIVKCYTSSTGGTVTSVSSLRSVGLAGKAFAYDSVVRTMSVYDGEFQSTYFLIRPTGFDGYPQGTVVGKLAPLNAGGTPQISTLPAIYEVESGEFQFPYLLKANPTTLAGEVQSTLILKSAIFRFGAAPPKIGLANNTHLGGSLLTGYDLASGVEYGFNVFPEGGSAETIPLIGGIAAGDYSYKFTYEWIDAFGQAHRSAPSTGLPLAVSVPYIQTGAGNGLTQINVRNGTILAPGAIVQDISSDYAPNTTVTSISTFTYPRVLASISAAVTGAGTWASMPTSYTTTQTFAFGASATTTNRTIGVTKPTIMYAHGSCVSGSNQITVYQTKGLAVGLSVADNFDYIPGGTTITDIEELPNGALLTLSANATGTGDNMFEFTGASFPLSAFLGVGMTITGTYVPANTEILEIDDDGSTITISNSPTLPAGTGSSTFTTTEYYSVKLSVPTLRLTEKGRTTQPVQIAVWRTTAAGTQYYKVGYITNDTTIDSVTFVDRTSDGDLIGNTQLYTNGGEVENIAPPASDFLTSYKNRAILLPAEDGYSWWFSKQVVPGSPVEFSDLFVQSIDQRGGPLTAAGPLDDKLVFFKQANIFYIVGDGPAPSGANNDFSYPQLVTSDCGCTEPKSLVTIPSGIIFRSAKGFHLLDRGLNLTYIGAEVEAFNSTPVRSAQLLANTTQVRFTLEDGTALMFDYLAQQWGEFTNVDGVDATVWGTDYVYLSPAGRVLRETPDSFSDDGAPIVTGFTTGWISFDKLQNFQRLWKVLVVGEWASPHTLTFTAAQDLDETPTQTDTLAAATAIVPYQFRYGIIRQKCEAVQISVTCTPNGPPGAGASFSALGFEFGMKRGLQKLPASRSR